MKKKNGLAIAALVLAIISVATFWVPFVNVGAMFIALIGLILGLCALGHPKKTMAIIAAALCVVAIVGAISINNSASKAINEAVDEFNESVDELDEAFDELDEALEEVAEDTEYVLFQSEIESTSVEVAAEPTESMTTGQKNAMEAAKKYLRFTAFSHDGLVEQLEFEKYSHEDAVYAADNCGADWFEQAAKRAETYLGFSSFSKDGLIEQLEFEKFTHEQAVYGAEQNGY